ncbi:ATP-binding cassette domain-containing protein [Sulfitobacter albidus]|uniref:ATP-binding cassette domain-containing protein n=1 Tax=Sulfitobacter albidus TaxID=2829501 RepID=A0A975JBA4_9RHOB|nr:ATP-binding cassette domain-containing protein [Sulfitobacter albidus]QUJ75283.1 ATP-binding cassette domain-containing protein [Sulfitobacter albidus]
MAYIVTVSTLLLIALLSVPFLFGDFVAYQIGLFLIYGIAGQGIGFLWGRSGILPFGQAAFFGVAAYACAHVLLHVPSLPLAIICLLGVIAAAGLIAFLLGSVVFKGKTDSGPYFSLITLALALITEQVAGTATGLTGGFNGLSGFQTIADLNQFGSFYFVIVAAVLVSTVLLLSLDRLPAGLVARAIADNERRLQLFGFPTHLAKGAVFGLSAALAALAGILFANHQGIVTPTSSGFLLSANFVIWAAVGGRFHVLGPLLGAVGIGYLSAELRDSFAYWEVLLALIFILVVLKAPAGIAGLVQNAIQRFISPSSKARPPVYSVPAPRVEQSSEPLSFTDTHVQIGPVRILNGVNLHTPKKGIVCIIGPNGAGKTSLLNVTTGNLPVQNGELRYAGRKIHNRAPHEALKSGIARKLQVPSVFPSLSVADNLCIAMLAGRAGLVDFFRPSALDWRSAQLDRILATPGLPLLEGMARPASDLPQGHRQFLEFTMTAVSEPSVLLLDEPCAGLSPTETKLMTELVRAFQDSGQGLVLLIEHDMSIVRSLSSHVVVMHQGAVLAEGTFDEIQSNQDVRAVYAGGTK